MSQLRPRRSRIWVWSLAAVFGSLFTLGGIYAALFFVVVVLGVFFPASPIPQRAAEVMKVVKFPVPLAPAQTANPATASQNPPPEAVPVWEDKDRVNILLLGLDQRPNERGQPSRSDTMIVATIDPVTKTAGLLSIPRDLAVAVPGFGEWRVNAAHFLGDYYKVPGGGPELAKKTVQLNLGVRIHYYVRIDFGGFEKIVDTLGGASIDVQRPLRDDEYPAATEAQGSFRIYFPPGIQRLNGRDLLRYARSRHADSDIGRMQRQQQVLFALRNQALSLNALARLPQLVGALRDAYSTDLDVPQMLALARLAAQIKSQNIQSRAIDQTLVVERYDGALVPKRREIGVMVREFFFDGRLKQEGAHLELLNGTQHSGFAANLRDDLKTRGFTVDKIDSASSDQFTQTVIYVYTGKQYTAQKLADTLRVPRSSIKEATDGPPGIDIRVILGADAQFPQ